MAVKLILYYLVIKQYITKITILKIVIKIPFILIADQIKKITFATI